MRDARLGDRAEPIVAHNPRRRWEFQIQAVRTTQEMPVRHGPAIHGCRFG